MPVTDRNISLADAGHDDLPRTLRREREAQQRAQQQHSTRHAPSAMVPQAEADRARSEGPQTAVVTAFKVPFLRLMLFMIKAVLAAIPALLLFGVILWGLGHLLMAYYPWLVKVQILIHVPK